MKVYNGEGMILGRLAGVVAKELLLGEDVFIVNCDKIIISGKKQNVFAHEKQRSDRRGYPLKSSVLPRVPDRYVRRVVRGMLPWKQTRGKEAFKRVMCYNTVPAEFQGKELLSVKGASMRKLPTLKYVTVGQICKSLGGKA